MKDNAPGAEHSAPPKRSTDPTVSFGGAAYADLFEPENRRLQKRFAVPAVPKPVRRTFPRSS